MPLFTEDPQDLEILKELDLEKVGYAQPGATATPLHASLALHVLVLIPIGASVCRKRGHGCKILFLNSLDRCVVVVVSTFAPLLWFKAESCRTVLCAMLFLSG